MWFWIGTQFFWNHTFGIGKHIAIIISLEKKDADVRREIHIYMSTKLNPLSKLCRNDKQVLKDIGGHMILLERQQQTTTIKIIIQILSFTR